MGKNSESFLKISDFVFRFKRSSKRFVVEILTQNVAFNVSGVFFFIGLGCSLKWWYKDQFLIVLLKQNLPALSEPQQKISWETGEYLINEQTREFLEKEKNGFLTSLFGSLPKKVNGIDSSFVPINSINECTCTSLKSEISRKAQQPSSLAAHGAQEKVCIFCALCPQAAKGQATKHKVGIDIHPFSKLTERVDVYSNSVVVKFKSPWQKHAYHRFVGIFPESVRTERLASLESPLSLKSVLAPNDQLRWSKGQAQISKILPTALPGAHSFVITGGDKRAPLTNVVGHKEQAQHLNEKYAFFKLPKDWFKLSARGLCILNEKSFFQPTIWTFFGRPTVNTLKFPLNTICEIPEKNIGALSTIFTKSPKSCDQTPALKKHMLQVTEGQCKGNLADYTPLNANLAQLSSVVGSRFFVDNVNLSGKTIKKDLLVARPSHCNFLVARLANGLGLKHKESATSNLYKQGNQDKLSYPLTLTKSINGWQPPVETLVLSSYFDEIPYKLESTFSNSLENIKAPYKSDALFEIEELLKNELQTLIYSLPLIFVNQSFSSESTSKTDFYIKNLNETIPSLERHKTKKMVMDFVLRFFKPKVVYTKSMEIQQAERISENNFVNLGTQPEKANLYSSQRFDQRSSMSLLSPSLPSSALLAPLTEGHKAHLWGKVQKDALTEIKDLKEGHKEEEAFLARNTAQESKGTKDAEKEPNTLVAHSAQKSMELTKDQTYACNSTESAANDLWSKHRQDVLGFAHDQRSKEVVLASKQNIEDFKEQAKQKTHQNPIDPLFLLNKLGITFNNLSLLKCPPILLPTNQDASFWVWNKEKYNKQTNQNERVDSFQNFYFDSNTLIWQILQPVSFGRVVPSNMVTNLLLDEIQNQYPKKPVDLINKIILKQKKSTIENIDNVNPVDTLIKLKTKRMKFMSGYIYPDEQNNSLEFKLYRWIQLQSFGFLKQATVWKPGKPINNTLNTNNNLLNKLGSFTIFRACRALTEICAYDACFASKKEDYNDLVKRREGHKQEGAHNDCFTICTIKDCNNGKGDAQREQDTVRTKSSLVFSFQEKPQFSSNRELSHYKILSPKAFRKTSRFIDTACLSGVKIPNYCCTCTLPPGLHLLCPFGANTTKDGKESGKQDSFVAFLASDFWSKHKQGVLAGRSEGAQHALTEICAYEIEDFKEDCNDLKEGHEQEKGKQKSTNKLEKKAAFPLLHKKTKSIDRSLSLYFNLFLDIPLVQPVQPVQPLVAQVVNKEQEVHNNENFSKTTLNQKSWQPLVSAAPSCDLRSQDVSTFFKKDILKEMKWRFDHRLAHFPGFPKPNQFLLSITQITQGNDLSENAFTQFYDASLLHQAHIKSIDNVASLLPSSMVQYGQNVTKKHNVSPSVQQRKSNIDCNPRKTAYRGVVAQRNSFTKDFQSPEKTLKVRSLWGTTVFGPENPLTDKQSHFFGQRRLSTTDVTPFQRDYLRQLGKETLAQSNFKGHTERATSIERVKILSFSKSINSFLFKKRKYTYSLEDKDQWHLLFQEQLRSALEDYRKYPPLTPEEAKDYVPNRIKIAAPLMMVRFPKKQPSQKVLAVVKERADRILFPISASSYGLHPMCSMPFLANDNAYSEKAHNDLASTLLMHTRFCCTLPPEGTEDGKEGAQKEQRSKHGKGTSTTNRHVPKLMTEGKSTNNSFFAETYNSPFNSTLWLNKGSFPFVNKLNVFTQEVLNANSWLIISQWSFLVALLVWVEQTFLGDIFPALFTLEQLLLGATGLKSSDRTQVIRISKGDTPKFKNIAGVDGLLGELAELVLFLRGHKERLWNKKTSYGVLLTGPPGTGKTFLVRALANEAKVPVLILSAGTLTSHKTNSSKPSWSIRHAFRRAKQLAPCILFIDEIDALGRSRGKIATDINEIVANTNHSQVSCFDQKSCMPLWDALTEICAYEIEDFKEDCNDLVKRREGHKQEEACSARGTAQATAIRIGNSFNHVSSLTSSLTNSFHSLGSYASSVPHVFSGDLRSCITTQQRGKQKPWRDKTMPQVDKVSSLDSQQSWKNVLNRIGGRDGMDAYNEIFHHSLSEDGMANLWKNKQTEVAFASSFQSLQSPIVQIGQHNPRSTKSHEQDLKSSQTRENADQSTQKETMRRKFGPLTQLLVSMDGISSLSGVLMMGATNRPELLDPALTRPGRFERIIRIEKPAEQKRIEILQLYSRNLGFESYISPVTPVNGKDQEKKSVHLVTNSLDSVQPKVNDCAPLTISHGGQAQNATSVLLMTEGQNTKDKEQISLREFSWSYLGNRTVGLTAADLAVAMNYSSLKAIFQGTPHTIETIEYGLDSIARFSRAPVPLRGMGQAPLIRNKRSKFMPYSFDTHSLATSKKERLIKLPEIKEIFQDQFFTDLLRSTFRKYHTVLPSRFINN